MHDEESLLHRIYKAWYFPKVNFFESKLGPNHSCAWRGIWEAKNILLKGCRWRISDERTTKLWTEPWLPGYPKLSSSTDLFMEERSEDIVSSLPDNKRNTWNLKKLNELFNLRVVAEILKVTLSPTPREDRRQMVMG